MNKRNAGFKSAKKGVNNDKATKDGNKSSTGNLKQILQIDVQVN